MSMSGVPASTNTIANKASSLLQQQALAEEDTTKQQATEFTSQKHRLSFIKCHTVLSTLSTVTPALICTESPVTMAPVYSRLAVEEDDGCGNRKRKRKRASSGPKSNEFYRLDHYPELVVALGRTMTFARLDPNLRTEMCRLSPDEMKGKVDHAATEYKRRHDTSTSSASLRDEHLEEIKIQQQKRSKLEILMAEKEQRHKEEMQLLEAQVNSTKAKEGTALAAANEFQFDVDEAENKKVNVLKTMQVGLYFLDPKIVDDKPFTIMSLVSVRGFFGIKTAADLHRPERFTVEFFVTVLNTLHNMGYEHNAYYPSHLPVLTNFTEREFTKLNLEDLVRFYLRFSDTFDNDTSFRSLIMPNDSYNVPAPVQDPERVFPHKMRRTVTPGNAVAVRYGSPTASGRIDSPPERLCVRFMESPFDAKPVARVGTAASDNEAGESSLDDLEDEEAALMAQLALVKAKKRRLSSSNN